MGGGKAVLGFLLLFAGGFGIYLVLSGNLATAAQSASTSTGTGTGTKTTTAAKAPIINNPNQGYQPGKLSGMN